MIVKCSISDIYDKLLYDIKIDCDSYSVECNVDCNLFYDDEFKRRLRAYIDAFKNEHKRLHCSMMRQYKQYTLRFYLMECACWYCTLGADFLRNVIRCKKSVRIRFWDNYEIY